MTAAVREAGMAAAVSEAGTTAALNKASVIPTQKSAQPWLSLTNERTSEGVKFDILSPSFSAAKGKETN